MEDVNDLLIFAGLARAKNLTEAARTLGLPAILVVGVRLGCINHALLSQLAIESHGTTFAGWIANTVDPAMPRQKENLETLRHRLNAAPLATVPRLAPDSPPLALTEAAAQLMSPRNA